MTETVCMVLLWFIHIDSMARIFDDLMICEVNIFFKTLPVISLIEVTVIYDDTFNYASFVVSLNEETWNITMEMTVQSAMFILKYYMH